MVESVIELESRLTVAISPGFGERLLDRGQARGLIWRDGVLPQGAPEFRERLTEDLLDYGHTVLEMALRLRSVGGKQATLEEAFLVAGEAIEAAVCRGDQGRPDRGFHLVAAAVAFHLARYAARAYSILPAGVSAQNLAPTERALVQLMRRSLDQLYSTTAAWLLDAEHQDENIAKRLVEDREFDDSDAIHNVLTTSFMRGLAMFDHAIRTGEHASAVEAQGRLFLTAGAAKDLHAVSHWWTSTMASHLVDDLWKMSLHRQIPILPPSVDDAERWNSLRRSYIQRLRVMKRSTIELWPSQLEAASRAIDPADDLVVALPTSSGKTRIAELCILRTMATTRRAVYVTPLRALSAQTERDLAEVFLPLGISVSALYGAAAIGNRDSDMLRQAKIVVTTPEKLDFALRNDASLIDDVGLVVLDEGQMLAPSGGDIGVSAPGEREVRYEALVQRLLRRPDADSRRVVCLSALFPPPEEMTDLVSWLRRDKAGTAVHSVWRPTRQRYGVVRWQGGGGRLEITVRNQGPFVPRFVAPKEPPATGRRRLPFPHTKNELALASAWQFVAQDKAVLIYCPTRRSVETLGRLAAKCIEQGLLPTLSSFTPKIQDAVETGMEWLGVDHPAVRCLRHGIALHHGGLPRPFLDDVEQMLRSGECLLTIASPTLAQGLNLTASVLLIPSIWRSGQIIPNGEFANVAGRAGRAFVDVEGLILHVVWEDDRYAEFRAIRDWEQLVARAKLPAIASSLLLLADVVLGRIAGAAGVALEEVVEYLTGQGDGWELKESQVERAGVGLDEWERDIASLDAAILALLDCASQPERLASELDAALQGSLFSRQLAIRAHDLQALIRRFLVARACHIWAHTDQPQRKGYHAAGIGLKAGSFLDANLPVLVSLLLRAEGAVESANSAAAADAIVEFARLVLMVPPFRPSKAMPATWEDALRGWVMGQPASAVVDACSGRSGDMISDVFSYRLPWAMEAVRVHALAASQPGAEEVKGDAAMVVEVGSTNRAVAALLRAGLSSREAAAAAVASTGATFLERAGMLRWLRTHKVGVLTKTAGWPTPRSRHAWLQFFDRQERAHYLRWARQTDSIGVEWFGDAPDVNTHVVVEPGTGLVLTIDLVRLGVLRSPLGPHRGEILDARVTETRAGVAVEYFEPPPC